MTVTPRSFARLSRTATRTARTDGLVHRLDRDLREAPGERGLRLEPGLVLLRGRRADAGDLAAGEGRLERLREVPDRRRGQLVDLVEEDDDRRVADLDEEVAEELGLRLDRRGERQQRHVEDPDVAELLRDRPGGDPQREPLDDRRLAGAGRAQQERVALRAPQQHLDDRVELALATDDRAQLALPGEPDEVPPEPGERRRRGRPGRPFGRSSRPRRRARRSSRRPRSRGRSPARGGRSPCPGTGRSRSSGRRSRGGRRGRRRRRVTPRPFASASRTLMRIGRVAALVELRHADGREAPGERVVERDRRAVLLGRRRPDDRDVAAGERRLQRLAGAHAALAPAEAREQVDLVEEQDDPGLARFGHELGHPLLELAAVLRAGAQRGQRHLDDPRATERGGDAPRDDPLGEALDDRGLADAGRSQQDGVALGAADEDLDHPGRLVLAPDRRPEEPLGGELRQVPAELVQERRGVRAGRRGAGSRAVGRVRRLAGGAGGVSTRCGAGRLPRGPGRRSGGPTGDLGGPPRRVGQLVDAPLEPVEGKVEPGLVGAGRLGRGPNGRAGRASLRLGHAQWTRSRSAAVSGSFAAVTARPCPARRSASPASRWPGPARCTPATCRSRSRAPSRSSASCRARRP